MARPAMWLAAMGSLSLATAIVAEKMTGPNMNGDYVISPTPNAPKDQTFNTKWSEYPGGVEYFDVYMGPITHRYSEVFWTSLPETPVPPELVKRFEGKGMAITGYEVDQVMKKGDKDPYGKVLTEDTSVPINWAYNHHHDLSIVGAGSRMEKVPYGPEDNVPLMMRSDPNHVTVPVEHTASKLGIPTSAGLHEGNGGEYRKSYHGFAAPIAYVLDSPRSVHVLPMQIDTWNRDEMNLTNNKFVPGPQPRRSLAPQGPDALYSGLLECPLTDRVLKTIAGGTGFNDSFAAQIFECPSNVSQPLSEQHLLGYSEDAWPWPAHAFASATAAPDSEELSLYWNPAAGGGDHWLTFGAGQAANATAAGYTLARRIGAAPTAKSAASKKPVYLHYSAERKDHFSSASPKPPSGYASLGLQGYLLALAVPSQAGPSVVRMAWYTSPEAPTWGEVSGDNVLAQDDGKARPTARRQCAHEVSSAEQCFAAVKAMEGVGNATLQTATGASASLAPGCTVSYAAAGTIKAFFNTAQTERCCGEGVAEVSGVSQSLVRLEVNVSGLTGGVRISLRGPSAVWFGVGFFAQTMADAPYSIVVDGSGAVSERRMANHAAGRLLPSSVSVLSNTVAAGMRTVVLSRPALLPGGDHANFSMTQLQLPFISAVGSTAALSYHKAKTAATLALWPSAGQRSLCMCAMPAAAYGKAEGTIKYLPTGEQFGFTNFCQPEPRESVLAQRNPTCDVRAYVGGLQVCKHMWSLLDAEQESDSRVQRWKSLPLTYYQKYRIYFQDYVPGHHIGTLGRQGWGIAAAGGLAEYDVPRFDGPADTPPEKRTWEIWGVLTPGGDNLYLAAVHFHCHAPTCLEMAIHNNVTGELICKQNPIYGGTGQIDQSRFDEPGYILQPPCLWGEQPGLEPMPKASGVKFLITAITNSTYGHHGEMAFPEVTLVPWKANSSAYRKPKQQ